MNFELNEILTIIDKVKTTGLDSFEYQDTDVKLKIRGQKVETGNVADGNGFAGSIVGGNVSGGALACGNVVGGVMSGGVGMDANGTFQMGINGAENTLFVESPMVGTFYHAPSEDAEPFVAVGDRVTKGQIVGIIEAMKLMNEIPSEVDGIVEEILVDNETIVEFGQPLIRVRKA